MIEVYHMTNTMSREQRLSVSFPMEGAGGQITAARQLFAAGLYEKVAEIATDDLEIAWRLTNNIDSSWSMEPDPRVTLTAPLHVIDGKTYGRKSSEMGDVFVRDGVQYVVAMIGFEQL